MFKNVNKKENISVFRFVTPALHLFCLYLC